MKYPRFQFKRLQLKKETAQVVRDGHPWLFRDKLSTATAAFPDGQWLHLVDGENQTVGWGVYQATGGIGVRVLRKGENPPSTGWFRKLVEKAVAKRAPLQAETEAWRVFNGESDKLPGVTLDVYNGHGVLQTYTAGVDSLGRYLAALAREAMGLKSVLWKPPSKRKGETGAVRALWGQAPGLVRFKEGGLQLAADLRSGQKSGTFLDLRGLRRWLAEQNLRNARVLNLFAYTGAIGLAACRGGAREVVNVDAAQPSLDFGQKQHAAPAQHWVCADIFRWLGDLPRGEQYDWIIVDPPSMASTMDQVPQALATYRRIYRSLLPHLKPGGTIVACCCTSRISPPRFEQTVRSALGAGRPYRSLPMELDHKAGFSEANYLKVLAFHPSAARAATPPKLLVPPGAKANRRPRKG